MKYQLVLQWPASSIKDFDLAVEIQTLLVNRLSKQHEVDGHDAGSSEVNIFIWTPNPRQAFTEVVSILGSKDFWVDALVAYREETREDYIILWPKGLTEFSVE